MKRLKINGMNTSTNNYDAIEQLIFSEGIRIEAIDFHPTVDTMIVVLNTKAIISIPLSKYPLLEKASKSDLSDFTLIANGTGIHWNALDEDLSLKGFLQQELKRFVNSGTVAAA